MAGSFTSCNKKWYNFSCVRRYTSNSSLTELLIELLRMFRKYARTWQDIFFYNWCVGYIEFLFLNKKYIQYWRGKNHET